ncbi:MAG: FAD:protein FMN transferase [Proteobacteria bacterium]|nr:FAD:protein FMN transferase [Pseudomonadota bacterium]
MVSIIVFSTIGCQKKSKPDELVVFTGSTMGTAYSIKIAHFPDQSRSNQLQPGIDQLLTGINNSMSTFLPESDISKFNRYRMSDWFGVSSDLTDVVEEALRISDLSDGAFDITVGALVNLWGFGTDSRQGKIPGDGEIRKLQRTINYHKIEIKRKPSSLRKENPWITLDLAAIAKGYAVDRVAFFLERKGLKDYLVEIGGEIRTGGYKFEKQPWIVAIERPVTFSRTVQKIVELKGRSMATSGDYRNYFEKDGKRYSHTINPRTGRPIVHNLASVSVVHDSCMTADALATALMVLGPERGYRLAVGMKLAAFFIVRTTDGFEEKMTPEFKAHIHSPSG